MKDATQEPSSKETVAILKLLALSKQQIKHGKFIELAAVHAHFAKKLKP